jgi:class 3 adenylate cyclase
MGDAIMAIFRGQFHLDRAIEASLAVRKQIEKLPQPAEGLSFLPKLSIGINSGEMISGNIGSANLRRLDYTVIGDTVNTAQRLQSVAKQGQIVINEDSYQKVKDSFHCEKIGEVSLKHKAKLVTIYEVVD